jgi:hypothetical protein
MNRSPTAGNSARERAVRRHHPTRREVSRTFETWDSQANPLFASGLTPLRDYTYFETAHLAWGTLPEWLTLPLEAGGDAVRRRIACRRLLNATLVLA